MNTDQTHERFEQFAPTNLRALVRHRGTLKVVPVASRKGQMYIQHGSGFARICDKLGEEYVTSVSGVAVVEIGEL